MYAFTAGNSCNATQQALVKNDMKPNPTWCFSLKESLYFALRSMIGFMSTSLKVVNIAVSFFTDTNLRATVFRRLVIFSLFCPLLPGIVVVGCWLFVDGVSFE